jgi:hypothetical protein
VAITAIGAHQLRQLAHRHHRDELAGLGMDQTVQGEGAMPNNPLPTCCINVLFSRACACA